MQQFPADSRQLACSFGSQHRAAGMGSLRCSPELPVGVEVAICGLL